VLQVLDLNDVSRHFREITLDLLEFIDAQVIGKSLSAITCLNLR
jgi:hypothetical protein